MDLHNLRERLRKIPVAAEQKPMPKPAAGMLVQEHSEAADSRLYALSSAALARMGYAGSPLDIEKTLFIDTETTGLSGGVGTVAFLVGIGWISSGIFTVRQYLMRDYASESAMLSAIREAVKGFVCTVSFNGRTFDLPLLETRYTLQRERSPFAQMDCLDLLAPARRLWKRRLGSVRLVHLEERILGSTREDDLPGNLAPQRYFEYLKSGEESLLQDIIDHNRQDILSLGSLLCELCEAYGNPRALREKADLLSMGIAVGKLGEAEEAKELYRMAAQPHSSADVRSLTEKGIRTQAGTQLANLYRKEGNTAEREQTLQRMCARGEGDAWPHVELAKIAEHEHKDLRLALQHAKKALERATDLIERAEIEHRIQRIETKLRKQKGDR